jgi:hypothetical protein
VLSASHLSIAALSRHCSHGHRHGPLLFVFNLDTKQSPFNPSFGRGYQHHLGRGAKTKPPGCAVAGTWPFIPAHTANRKFSTHTRTLQCQCGTRRAREERGVEDAAPRQVGSFLQGCPLRSSGRRASLAQCLRMPRYGGHRTMNWVIRPACGYPAGTCTWHSDAHCKRKHAECTQNGHRMQLHTACSVHLHDLACCHAVGQLHFEAPCRTLSRRLGPAAP